MPTIQENEEQLGKDIANGVNCLGGMNFERVAEFALSQHRTIDSAVIKLAVAIILRGAHKAETGDVDMRNSRACAIAKMVADQIKEWVEAGVELPNVNSREEPNGLGQIYVSKGTISVPLI